MRRIAQQGLAHLRAHTALAQFVGVLVCLPALLFPTYVPVWAIAGSLAGLVLLLAAGRLLAGRLVVHTPLDVTIVLLLLLLPITVLITPDRDLTMPHVYKVIGSVALFYGVIGTLRDNPWFGLSALAISALGVMLAALTLFGTEWTLPKLPWLPFDPNQLFPRLVRPFWNPQGFSSTIAGGTLAMLVPVPIAYLLFGRRPLTRLGALLAVGIVTPVLLFTQARGALVALAIGLGAMLAIHDRRWFIVATLAGIVGAFAWRCAGVSSPVGAALDVPAGSAVYSAQGRLELWSRGWMMLQDFPFTGIGFGMVVRVMPMLYPTFVADNDRGIEHVHNLYLQAGVDLGFPGLIATLAFLLGLCYLSWCAVRRARGTEMKPLASGMLGGIIVFAVHGFTDNITFYAKAHLIAWALFGVAVAVWQRLVGSSRPTAHNVPLGRRDGHEAA
jgi:putative inorganic carbon (hco3(-)) transporter